MELSELDKLPVGELNKLQAKFNADYEAVKVKAREFAIYRSNRIRARFLCEQMGCKAYLREKGVEALKSLLPLLEGDHQEQAVKLLEKFDTKEE